MRLRGSDHGQECAGLRRPRGDSPGVLRARLGEHLRLGSTVPPRGQPARRCRRRCRGLRIGDVQGPYRPNRPAVVRRRDARADRADVGGDRPARPDAPVRDRDSAPVGRRPLSGRAGPPPRPHRAPVPAPDRRPRRLARARRVRAAGRARRHRRRQHQLEPAAAVRNRTGRRVPEAGPAHRRRTGRHGVRRRRGRAPRASSAVPAPSGDGTRGRNLACPTLHRRDEPRPCRVRRLGRRRNTGPRSIRRPRAARPRAHGERRHRRHVRRDGPAAHSDACGVHRHGRRGRTSGGTRRRRGRRRLGRPRARADGSGAPAGDEFARVRPLLERHRQAVRAYYRAGEHLRPHHA